MFELVAMQALLGGSIPISKILLKYTTPMFLAGIRMFISGIFLLGYRYVYTDNNFSFKFRYLWIYLQIAVVGIYLKYILRYWGLSQMPAAKMSFLLNISPFCAALFSYLAFNEKLSMKQWLGLCIGFTGLIPIILMTSSAEKLLGEIAFISWPELAILGAIAAHNYGLIVARKLMRDENHSAAMANGIRMFGGGILALMTSFCFEGFFPVTHVVPFVSLLSVLIILSNIISHNLYLYLLKYYSATFLSFSDFLSPIFTALYSWFFLREVITWHYGASALIVFVGLYLFYQDDLQESNHNKIKELRASLVQWFISVRRPH